MISSYSTKKINFSNTFCVNYETFSITRDFDIDKNVEKFKIIKQPLFIREGGEVILHFKENVIFEGYAEYTNRNIFINFNHRIEANNENQCFGTMIFPTIGYNQINYSYGISLFEETNHNYAESRVQVLKKAKNQNEEDLKYEEAEIDDKCPLFNKWKSDIEISKIIDHLMGRINRIIIPHHNQSVNRPPSPRQKEFRQLHFFSACYHASINNLTESINMLKNAKLHGFGTVSEDIKEIEIAKPIFKTAGILKELEIFENKVNH